MSTLNELVSSCSPLTAWTDFLRLEFHEHFGRGGAPLRKYRRGGDDCAKTAIYESFLLRGVPPRGESSMSSSFSTSLIAPTDSSTSLNATFSLRAACSLTEGGGPEFEPALDLIRGILAVYSTVQPHGADPERVHSRSPAHGILEVIAQYSVVTGIELLLSAGFVSSRASVSTISVHKNADYFWDRRDALHVSSADFRTHHFWIAEETRLSEQSRNQP